MNYAEPHPITGATLPQILASADQNSAFAQEWVDMLRERRISWAEIGRATTIAEGADTAIAPDEGAYAVEALLCHDRAYTGYAPIIRAAEAVAGTETPTWVEEDVSKVRSERAPYAPSSSDELAMWYEAHPEGTLIAGATDVGLWVTKGLKRLDPVISLARIEPLRVIADEGDRLRFGACLLAASGRAASCCG